MKNEEEKELSPRPLDRNWELDPKEIIREKWRIKLQEYKSENEKILWENMDKLVISIGNYLGMSREDFVGSIRCQGGSARMDGTRVVQIIVKIVPTSFRDTSKE